MALMTLSDALTLALSDKELIGEAIGVALAEKKAATTVGAEVAVSFIREVNETGRGGMTADDPSHEAPMRPALRIVMSRCMSARKPTRSPARRAGIHLVTVDGVRVDHARSLSVEAGTSRRRVK